MNKTDAKLIAETITYDQLVTMFNNAKSGIKDWSAVSDVNKGITKGVSWNILHGGLSEDLRLRGLGVKNMIWEFGDYLEDGLKPVKKTKAKRVIKVHHEDPIF